MEHSNLRYKRLPTRVVSIGELKFGGTHAIVPQTMTTPDTMDTEASASNY